MIESQGKLKIWEKHIVNCIIFLCGIGASFIDCPLYWVNVGSIVVIFIVSFILSYFPEVSEKPTWRKRLQTIGYVSILLLVLSITIGISDYAMKLK